VRFWSCYDRDEGAASAHLGSAQVAADVAEVEVLHGEEHDGQTDAGQQEQEGRQELFGGQRLRELALGLVRLADAGQPEATQTVHVT